MRFNAAFSLFLGLQGLASAGDWPQLLGPGRNGHAAADEPALAPAFPDDGPAIRWKKPVGHGFAGPVVAGDKVILFHRQGNDAVIETFAARDGTSGWRFSYPTPYRDDFGFDDGPRSAPTVADGRLVAYGAEGMLHCLDAQTGKLLWKHDLAAEFDAPKGFFGRCCAPLVSDGLALVNIGGNAKGKPAGVAAFRLSDGSPAWTGSSDEASYSSPIAATLAGRKTAVFFTRKGLEILDPASGSTLAGDTFEPEISASVSAATPVPCGPDRVFLSACYGVGAAVWEAGPEKSGGIHLHRLWSASDRLDSHYATPVFADGFLYGFHGRQEQGQVLRCIGAADGTVRWSSPTLPAGSVILAGKTLVILTEKGELILAPATPDGYKPQARGQILGAVTRALPALANGTLFARDGRQLVAVKLTP